MALKMPDPPHERVNGVEVGRERVEGLLWKRPKQYIIILLLLLYYYYTLLYYILFILKNEDISFVWGHLNMVSTKFG